MVFELLLSLFENIKGGQDALTIKGMSNAKIKPSPVGMSRYPTVHLELCRKIDSINKPSRR